jgi:TRAP transporter TAXI family solute receptor
MKKTLCILSALVILFAAAVCFAAPDVKRSDHFITVLTGPTSGIYFPIGGTFSTFIGSLGYKASATATGATAENINALITGQGELAIAMADSVIQAVESFGAYEGKPPSTELRAMMGL